MRLSYVFLAFALVSLAACDEGGVRGEIARAERELGVSGAKNLAASRAFLDANKLKAGVKTTASGLQYEITDAMPGDVPKPSAHDQVVAIYRGTLADGTEFDSSQGQPAAFALNQVIPAWTEGLQLMKAGETMKLYVPPELGYGAEGSPPRIPPNAALVFEIELLGFRRPDGEIVRSEAMKNLEAQHRQGPG
jgi:FKBP-type peptidyl-prolyl cis-trans isomerase